MTAAVAVPVIRTARLILREPRDADLPAMTAFATSPRTAYIGGPMAADEVPEYLARVRANWASRGYGWWTAEHRATGAVAGRTGIGHPGGYTEPELGWHIYDGFEGQGLAFEAAAAARDHAQRVMGLRGLVSLIHPANLRSKRLAARLGARFDRMGEVEGEACEVWLHPEAAA
jgi:RimJ/RimL family protein N-acetyltransferase